MNQRDFPRLLQEYGTAGALFRFYVPNSGLIANLTAQLMRDDGAVIYLNGAEIWRDTNMPAGLITNQTPALSALGGTNEAKWTSTSLNTAALRAGWNLLAAEVHQSALTSSDLGFDFKLTGMQAITERPALTFSNPSGVLALTWPASNGVFTLCSTTNLMPSIWMPAPNAPILTNGLWFVPLSAPANASRSFRLQSQ